LGLLGRAKTMMQGWAAPPPPRAQSYSVACAEGHRLTGQRTEGYQALRCPTCGDGIFVLPRSPLPIPPVPASAIRARVAAAADAFPEDDPILLTDPPTSATGPEIEIEGGDATEAEIDWVDEVPAGAGPVPEAPKANAPPARPKARAARRPDPGPAAEVDRPTIAVADRPTLAGWAWRHRNALLVAGVIALVVGAVSVRRWRQRLEELPEIAEIGRTEGLKRLDAGDFHAAKKLLADAASAVDSLGGRYEGAEAIRQGAREAAIFTDLAPEGLDRLLEEAATYRSEVKEWSSHFAGFYRGRSFLLETAIVAVPDPARPDSAYQVECRVFTGRGPRPDARARLDLARFRLFEDSRPKVGDPQVFGARLASLELDLATNEWVFAVEPDSGVFITHPKALEAVGWPAPEAPEEPRP